MATLARTLGDWQTDSFQQTLKSELACLPAGVLPLQAAAPQGGLVDEADITVTVLDAAEDAEAVRVKVGIFFVETVGGCSCGDEPMAQNAYCEMRIRIDKVTAEAAFSVSAE